MAFEAANRLVIVLNVPYDAGGIRGASNQNLVVELKAKNGRAVVISLQVGEVRSFCWWRGRRTDCRERRFSGRLFRPIVDRSCCRLAFGLRTDDLAASPGIMCIPHANGAVPRTSDNFMSETRRSVRYAQTRRIVSFFFTYSSNCAQ